MSSKDDSPAPTDQKPPEDTPSESDRDSQPSDKTVRDWDWKSTSNPPATIPEVTVAGAGPAIIQQSTLSHDSEMRELAKQQASHRSVWASLFGRRPMEATSTFRVPEDADPDEACAWLRNDPFAPRTLAVYPEICLHADDRRNPAGLNRYRRPNCKGPFVDYLCFFRLSGLLVIFNLFLLQEIPEPVRALLLDPTLYLITCFDEHYATALLNTDVRLNVPPQPACSLRKLLQLAATAGISLVHDLASQTAFRDLPLRSFGMNFYYVPLQTDI